MAVHLDNHNHYSLGNHNHYSLGTDTDTDTDTDIIPELDRAPCF